MTAPLWNCRGAQAPVTRAARWQALAPNASPGSVSGPCFACHALPLRQGLRSTDSATRHPALCSPPSSLLCLGPTPPRRASAAWLLPSLWRPRRSAPWQRGRPPRSRPCTYMRAWVLRRRRALPNLTIAVRAVLPSTIVTASALRIICISTLNSPTHMRPCRRFARTLAGTTTRLGERYGLVTSLTTEDSHLLYSAS